MDYEKIKGDVKIVENLNEPSQGNLTSYQETLRFRTWRKHTRDLYQSLFHIDLVWETPAAQLMPFVTPKGDVTTYTILSGTRTGGQEQAYLQLLAATLPSNTSILDSADRPYCDATGEVGGYGMSPSTCNLRVERRILHDGDVLAARYMYANPLLIASASSNGTVYIFDWSRISLNRFPNDPPRPRAPLPPNELSSNPSDEERINYQKRMRELNTIIAEQDRWDRRRGAGQHVLTLVGGNGPSDNLDWSTSQDGVLVSGSLGKVCAWKIGNLSKDDPRTVEPYEMFCYDNEEDCRISSVKFLWKSENEFVCSTTNGSIFYNDLRTQNMTEIFSLPVEATAVSTSPLDSNLLLVGSQGGEVFLFDLRQSSMPLHLEQLHEGEVTSLEWCPHSQHLFASGGVDQNVCIYNIKREKLLFKHAGHTDSIMDLGWNWQKANAGQLLSADSNALMLWRPRDYYFFT
ncbi:unnamed protein product [Phytomonas sp. Hart1]|nr:unnamed protein product [Phytomonas sp. Hart1]|eukprot:CCW66091.1 unnamed protein product [Phytomonas sp. isolate Hart1]